MPRLKTVSNLASSISSETLNQVKVNPTHITLFCSEKEGEFLLNPLPDVKPVDNLEQFPKLKTKIFKNHLKLQASAREAFKLALSSNQIRDEGKMIVLNSKLFQIDQSDGLRKEGSLSLQRMIGSLKKQPKVQQKLTKAIQAFPIQNFTGSPQLSNKWMLDDTNASSQHILCHPYTLLINPTILYASQLSTLPQQCICFPFMQFMIPRYNRLLIHFYNQNFKSQFVYTSGFVSRVIQHHCQHLEGKNVLDWRVNHGSLMMNESVLKYFPKATAVVEDYGKSLKAIFKQFPELIQVSDDYCIEGRKLNQLLGEILRTNHLILDEQEQPESQKFSKGRNSSRSLNKKLAISNNYNSDFTINKKTFNDQLPFEDDFIVRIVKHFKKEFAKFDEKIQLGLIDTEQFKKENRQEGVSKDTQVTYNEEEYAKLIKIKYLNSQKDFKLNSEGISKEQKSTKKDSFQEADDEVKDEDLDKALARHKKGKKRK